MMLQRLFCANLVHTRRRHIKVSQEFLEDLIFLHGEMMENIMAIVDVISLV